MSDSKEPLALRSPTKTIRAHCLACSGGSSNEVELCPVTHCILHPWRFGRDPRRAKRVLTEEQRQIMQERFAKNRKPIAARADEQGDDFNDEN